MTEPTSLLVCGDTHGNPQHIVYLVKTALKQDVQGMLICGDFGYWEHQKDGWAYLDMCSELAVANDMPFYWVDGNHECHPKLRADYGPGGPKHKLTPEGFWEIRPGVYYIPRGTRWTWNGVRMMGLGGAYSIDKTWRLAEQARSIQAAERKNDYRRQAGAPERTVFPEDHALWWKEEELTDEDVAYALRDPEPIDILFTHDKPRKADPRWNRRDLPLAYPNQDKIQTVVDALHPRLLIHGHLHYRYTDSIPCGEYGMTTVVEGLDADPEASHYSNRPDLSWLRLTLEMPDDV